MEDWYLIIKKGQDEFIKIQNSTKNSYYADPFLYYNDGYYIFFEEFDNTRCKGHISYIKLDDTNYNLKPVKIIDEKFHLSYPFLIECNSKLYMIPESYQANTIYLYESVSFPYIWDKKELIKNINAVDSTLLFYENKYWLFTSVLDSECKNRYLSLFYSDSLYGTWTAHPINKFKIFGDLDHGSGRGAGNIYMEAGFLYRPIQMSEKFYGESIQINRILILSVDDFIEINNNHILTPFDSGTHHISKLDDYTVMDIKRYI